MSFAATSRAPDERRVPGTSSVTTVIALTLITLSAYFYFYLYRALGRLEETAAVEEERRSARATRWCVTAGLGVQFVAVLALLGGVVPFLAEPEGHAALWKALEQGRIQIPVELARADAVSNLLNWVGWIVFWGPLFAFLARALQAEGEPLGASGFALAMIGVRVLVGLLGALGLGGLAASIGALDAIVYFALVGCCVSATNSIVIARAAGS